MLGTRQLLQLPHDYPTSHWDGAQKGRHYLFSLLFCFEQVTEGRCVYRTRTNGVDTDLALFQIDGPRTSEGSDGRLCCAVNTHRLVSFGSYDRSS